MDREASKLVTIYERGKNWKRPKQGWRIIAKTRRDDQPWVGIVVGNQLLDIPSIIPVRDIIQYARVDDILEDAHGS